MERYIGTKIINAKPMDRGNYNIYRGWKLPLDEDGTDAGYLVEYLDGGKPNTEDYNGYVSWSPKDVFERAYRDCKEMNFGLALNALKRDSQVTRAGWNGEGMWLGLVEDTYAINFMKGKEIHGYSNHPYIVMKTVDGKIVPWTPSQTDMLAEDWEIVG